MIHHRFEPLNYLLNTGLAELGERSWGEIGNDKELFSYDPDWQQYQADENNNILRFYALRNKDEILIGYASILLLWNRHDRKILCAVIQDIYIEPEHRNYAIFSEFHDTLENHLKSIGVKHISIGERENDPRGGIGSVYRRKGYNSCERIWTKVLGN